MVLERMSEPGAAGSPGLLGRWRREVSKPVAHHALEEWTIEAVVAGATFAADLDHTGMEQDIQVACGGWPTVREAAGEIAGGELGTELAEEQDELAPGGVGEGCENGVDFVEVCGSGSDGRQLSTLAKC
jgi:hypothetical protein